MVDTQIRPSDVTRFPVIDAFLAVPRELFVPAERRDAAYAGENIEIGPGRVLLDPRTLAKMIEALDVEPDDLVLDIGAGTGYPAAVLSYLAEAIVAVEEDPGLAREVGAALADTESIALMNLRGVICAVEGSEPGAGANVTKLLGSEVAQRNGAIAARIAGPAAAVREGDAKRVGTWIMAMTGATIGGGTSEIIRNQIAERLLDLPRDPLIK